MASGFNGQQFVFHGYLPVDKKSRSHKIREMEADIAHQDRTQIFIEAPYRNNQLLDSLVRSCQESTMLCVASELTTENEMVIVRPIEMWKRSRPDLHKKPAVFLLYH
jgi:16S rRNA (cytidine1402-2'-O)-methyltransferase